MLVNEAIENHIWERPILQSLWLLFPVEYWSPGERNSAPLPLALAQRPKQVLSPLCKAVLPFPIEPPLVQPGQGRNRPDLPCQGIRPGTLPERQTDRLSLTWLVNYTPCSSPVTFSFVSSTQYLEHGRHSINASSLNF